LVTVGRRLVFRTLRGIYVGLAAVRASDFGLTTQANGSLGMGTRLYCQSPKTPTAAPPLWIKD
jgi:hypothetical protein